MFPSLLSKLKIFPFLIAFVIVAIALLLVHTFGTNKISNWVLIVTGLVLTTLLTSGLETFLEEIRKKQEQTQKLYQEYLQEIPLLREEIKVFSALVNDNNFQVNSISTEQIKLHHQMANLDASVKATHPDSLIKALRFTQNQLDAIEHYLIVMPDSAYEKFKKEGKTMDFILDMLGGENEETTKIIRNS